MVTGPYLNSPGSLVVYEQGLSVRLPDVPSKPPGPGGARRGDITEFTRRSRTRLLRQFSRIQWSQVDAVRFVTLTWHEGWRHQEQRPAEVLNAFLTDLRRAWPGLLYVWRLEAQRRGAPHFHLLLMWRRGAAIPSTDVVTGRCVETWHRLADPTSEAHRKYGVDVQECTDWGKTWAYLCKYCGKVNSNESAAIPGRQWATSRNLPQRPIFSAPLDKTDWQLLRPILRRLLKARKHTTERTLEWFDGASTLHLYITGDEFRTEAPDLWEHIRRRGVCARDPRAMLRCQIRDEFLNYELRKYESSGRHI